MAKLTSLLLARAAKAAQRNAKLSAEITAAFEDRYGTTYSAIDADDLIDSLDYGLGGEPTLAECDAIMAAAGHPARPSQAPGGRDGE